MNKGTNEPSLVCSLVCVYYAIIQSLTIRSVQASLSMPTQQLGVYSVIRSVSSSVRSHSVCWWEFLLIFTSIAEVNKLTVCWDTKCTSGFIWKAERVRLMLKLSAWSVLLLKLCVCFVAFVSGLTSPFSILWDGCYARIPPEPEDGGEEARERETEASQR